jgi:hypothetical protein
MLLNNKPEDKDKKVVAIIVTFSSGSTYDHIFASVEQKSLEGTKVLVYRCHSNHISKLLDAFDGKEQD